MLKFKEKKAAFKAIGLCIVFAWFFGGGVAHFVNPGFFVNIMPDYLPWHYEAVYISGVFEILGAVGVLIPYFRRFSGNGLALLTVVVTPANIHMWLNPQLYPEIPPAFLTLRLFIQVLLLMCIIWSTRMETGFRVSQLVQHVFGDPVVKGVRRL